MQFSMERALSHAAAAPSCSAPACSTLRRGARRRVQVHVITPPRTADVISASAALNGRPAPAVAPAPPAPSTGGADLAGMLSNALSPVKVDMETMNTNLKNVVGNRHPMLMAAAEQIFGAGGKKLRPAIVFLVARATAHLMGLP